MIWILMLLLSQAQAGFLRIDGQSDIRLDEKNGVIELRGTYRIQNDGDEEARTVWPELILDQYQWKGYPQDLKPGGSYTWEFRKKLTDRELCLKVNEKCPLALPKKGQFLIQAHKHYQDKNGYLFVVPDVIVANLNSQDSSSNLDLNLKVSRDEAREYRGEYQLASKSDQDLNVVLKWLLPWEMDAYGGPIPFEIPAQGEVAGQFLFRNRSGLPGSHYVAIAIVEWVENGERRVSSKLASFQIDKPKSAAPFFKNDRKVLGWLVWAVFLGLILMWIFWIRPLKKLR